MDADRLRRSLGLVAGTRVGSTGLEPQLAYGRHRGPGSVGTKPAAVLLLLYPKLGQWHLPLILRPPTMSFHAGQVSLPGGGRKREEDAVACALREGEEELGVPRGILRVIGQLPSVFVYKSNFLVDPVIAFAAEHPNFCPDPREVVELLELPLRRVLEMRTRNMVVQRGPLRSLASCLDIKGQVVWGATIGMLAQLADVCRCA